MRVLSCTRTSWILFAGSGLFVCVVGSISGRTTKTESHPTGSARSDSVVTDELRGARFGTVKGRLVWSGPTAPILLPLVALGKADPNICSATRAIPNRQLVVDSVTKGIEYGIAYINQPKGRNVEAENERVSKAPQVVIDQKNCEFIPYVTVIHQDQVVKFRSSDPVNHNLHISPLVNPGFNQMISGNGTIEKRFAVERSVIPLTCDLHPWMTAYIKVFDHPFFAVTNKEGTFEISGVPIGEQRLVLWHPSTGFVLKELAQGVLINVEAEKTTDVGQIKLDPSRIRIEPSKFQVSH